MITLFTFGRRFGLPDPSPFVTKTEVLLKMSGLPFRIDTEGFGKAPKGKLPYIDDDGSRVADSTFIRWHIERKHGVDFDAGLDAREKAICWAVEKMCDEHLYWAIIDSRWLVDANFVKGPKAFFDKAPAPIRPLIIAMVRRQVRKAMWGHGIGRHSRDEIEMLAAADIAAIAAILGDKDWMMGPEPRGVDATTWSFVAGALCPFFDSPIRAAAASHANLVAYAERGFARWYPDLRGTTA